MRRSGNEASSGFRQEHELHVIRTVDGFVELDELVVGVGGILTLLDTNLPNVSNATLFHGAPRLIFPES